MSRISPTSLAQLTLELRKLGRVRRQRLLAVAMNRSLLYEAVRRARRSGMTLREIESATGVSNVTISIWTRGVKNDDGTEEGDE